MTPEESLARTARIEQARGYLAHCQRERDFLAHQLQDAEQDVAHAQDTLRRYVEDEPEPRKLTLAESQAIYGRPEPGRVEQPTPASTATEMTCSHCPDGFAFHTVHPAVMAEHLANAHAMEQVYPSTPQPSPDPKTPKTTTLLSCEYCKAYGGSFTFVTTDPRTLAAHYQTGHPTTHRLATKHKPLRMAPDGTLANETVGPDTHATPEHPLTPSEHLDVTVHDHAPGDTP